MKEVWKDVVGYEGLYEVSNLGNIRVVRKGSPFYLAQKAAQKNNRGYFTVLLSNGCGKQRRLTIHRIVAEAFLSNPCNYPQVNHKDENKTNNCVDNLEWCSRSYNVRYSMERHPERAVPREHKNNSVRNGKKTSLRVQQLTLNGEVIKEWPNSRTVFRETGMSDWSISQCCRGIWKTAYGFKWQYAN